MSTPLDVHDLDPVTLEVFRHLFSALTEEMGAALRRASFSPNIKERRDYSCALFGPEGAPVALGDHMPVHLGAMPMSVEAAVDELGHLAPGDVVMVNDPFRGGTHLPDITLIRGVFGQGGTVLGYVASRAHHSDVGGMSPGSMPLAREIVQEGVRIPPVRLHSQGVRNEDLWRLVLANVRTPEERSGDLDAQLAALHTGAERLKEIALRRGTGETLHAMSALRTYADRLVRSGLEQIPDGVYRARDVMEDDGYGHGPFEIVVSLEICDGNAVVDFTGSAPQAPGGINAVAAITASAVRYVIRCVVETLLDGVLPAGGGSMNGVRIVLPPDTIVNAGPPASVAAGNVETSQRITDVLLQAFAEALPERMPALSQGTMNNITVGGTDPTTGQTFAYYETVGGGMGAGPTQAGLSGVHVHMSNSLNTPIEALEHAYPFRVREYALRRGSGGRGRHAGGEGLVRDLELLGAAEVTLLTERRQTGPAGAQGGDAGARGQNSHVTAEGVQKLPGKVTLWVRPGDRIRIESPGGGGWGEPEATSTP